MRAICHLDCHRIIAAVRVVWAAPVAGPPRLTATVLGGFLGLVATTGCSNFTPKIFSHPGDASPLTPMTRDVHLTGAESEQAYQKVREAAAQNSVVLEVVGDKQPIRVLPLPPEGQSVFVSNLLNDTGVLEKLGTIDATLYRNSTHAIGGIRMEVKMTPGHTAVRPESDYALRPGDRLHVRKVEHAALTSLVSGVLGL